MKMPISLLERIAGIVTLGAPFQGSLGAYVLLRDGWKEEVVPILRHRAKLLSWEVAKNLASAFTLLPRNDPIFRAKDGTEGRIMRTIEDAVEMCLHEKSAKRGRSCVPEWSSGANVQLQAVQAARPLARKMCRELRLDRLKLNHPIPPTSPSKKKFRFPSRRFRLAPPTNLRVCSKKRKPNRIV